MVLNYFETNKDKGVCDGHTDFFKLTLVNGHEQEFLDRWDRILRDLGPDAPDEKILRHKFHVNMLDSDLMEDINDNWSEVSSDDDYRAYENLHKLFF